MLCFYPLRAFGHFEKPLFMELCKHVQTKFVPSGALLFGPGFIDDSIYVVRNGRLKVFIIEPVSECSDFFSDLLFLRPIACIHTQ